MRIVRKIPLMQGLIKSEKKQGKSIGFVPTMGYFHQGHFSLMAKARKDCDIAVVSIFVNPIQFGAQEDCQRYPKDLVRDKNLAKKAGVDYLFVPQKEEMYPEGFAAYGEVKGYSETLCGLYRPGHFRGVVTVLLKLFNIVQPDKVYFGWKDVQQLIIIKKMAADLNIPLKVVGLPTIREKDGLALSSRNSYLSPEARKSATVLYQALKRMKNLVNSGIIEAKKVLTEGKKIINSEPSVKLQYLAAVQAEDLTPVKKIKPGTLIAGAVFVDGTRLIDNLII